MTKLSLGALSVTTVPAPTITLSCNTTGVLDPTKTVFPKVTLSLWKPSYYK